MLTCSLGWPTRRLKHFADEETVLPVSTLKWLDDCIRATAMRWMLTLVTAVLLLTGCGSATAPADAPAGHTSVQDGVPHAPGLSNPAANCIECHGIALEGGANGEPSCFSCHGKEW